MPIPANDPLRHGRGRRPVAQVREHILTAAAETLFSRGAGAFTIDEVAKRSGASKTTIYKWWPSKGALALDGYFHAVENTLAFDDTVDVREDLRHQLHSFVGVMATPGGRALLELIGQSQTDPDLAAAYRAMYSSGRRRLAYERLERAQEAGELRADVDVRVLVDQLWGAVYHRLLVPDEPVTAAFVDAVVDNLFDGVRASR